MIGYGLKKLAKTHGMTVSNGVAYGSLMGYATTLSEGAGYKSICIATSFPEPGQQESLLVAVNAVDMKKLYRVENLVTYPSNIQIVFHDNPGTMKKIEEFIAWFYPLLDQRNATKANVCAECGGTDAHNWYLINGIAYPMHEHCAQHAEDEIRQEEQTRMEEDTGSYLQGTIGAFVGAALGAVVWGLVLYAGYVASLVGLLIGWLAEKGYTLLKGKQGKGKILILILAIIFGVVAGTLAVDVVTVAEMIASGEIVDWTNSEIPMFLMLLFQESEEYRSALFSNVGMGLLFAGLGVYALLRRTAQDVGSVKFKKLR